MKELTGIICLWILISLAIGSALFVLVLVYSISVWLLVGALLFMAVLVGAAWYH